MTLSPLLKFTYTRLRFFYTFLSMQSCKDESQSHAMPGKGPHCRWLVFKARERMEPKPGTQLQFLQWTWYAWTSKHTLRSSPDEIILCLPAENDLSALVADQLWIWIFSVDQIKLTSLSVNSLMFEQKLKHPVVWHCTVVLTSFLIWLRSPIIKMFALLYFCLCFFFQL